MRRQGLGSRTDEAVEGLLVPGDEAVGRALAPDAAALARVVADLGQGALVFDDVLGGLYDDGTDGVEARASGPAGDLVELAGPQVAHARPVVLRQAREENGADRHVDADPEGVGTADHLEQTGLGELLHKAAVLRQHAGVVDADAVADQAGQGLAEAGGEAEVAEQFGDPVLLLAGTHIGRHEGLCPLDRIGLGGVHDVDRRLVGLQQLIEGLVQGGEDEREVQRYRPIRARDGGRGPVGSGRQVLDESADVAEGGGHQQELRLRQGEQWDLPGPTAVGVGVEVELVHDDEPDVGLVALAQRLVGQHLGSADDDRGAGVDRGVARGHADVVGAEDLHEVEELLADQSLEGGGVEGAAALGEGGEGGPRRDEALARPGGGGQHHVAAGDQLDQRLLLRRVKAEPTVRGPDREGLEEGVRLRIGGQQVEEAHGPPMLSGGRIVTSRALSEPAGRATSSRPQVLRAVWPLIAQVVHTACTAARAWIHTAVSSGSTVHRELLRTCTCTSVGLPVRFLWRWLR